MGKEKETNKKVGTAVSSWTSTELLNALKETAVIVDASSQCVFFNHSAEEQFAVQAEEVLGKSLFDVITFMEVEPIHQHFRSVALGNTTKGLKVKLLINGRKTIAYLKVSKLGDEGLLLVTLEVREIQKETQLTSQSFEILDQFVQHTFFAMAVFDTEMRYIYASSSWTKLFELDQAELLGRSHYEVFPQIKEMSQWLAYHQEVLKGNNISRDLDQFVLSGGKECWLRWQMFPWYDGSGEIGGAVLCAQDVSGTVTSKGLLLDRNAQFDAVMRSSVSFVGLLSLDGRMLEMNDAALRMMGSTREELVGKYIQEVPDWFSDKSQQLEMDLAIEQCRLGMHRQFELMVDRDERKMNVDFSLSPIFNASNEVIYLLAEGRDISHRIDLERTLREKNEVLYEAQKLGGIGIWRFRLEDEKVFWDDVTYDLHEVPRGEHITEEDAIAFYHPDHQARVRTKFIEAAEHGKAYEYEAELLTRNGVRKWVRVVGYTLVHEGEVKELRGLIMDISKHHSLEQEKRIALEQFRYVFENNADLLAVHDPEGVYLSASPSSYALTGYHPEELIGTNFFDFVDRSVMNSKGMDDIQCVIKGERKDAVIEYPFKTKSGGVKWLLVTIRYIIDDEDNIIQWISTSKDITAQKGLEEEVSQMNRNLQLKVEKRTRDVERLNFELQQQFFALDSVAMVSIINPEGEIISVNDKFLNKLGYSKQELIGRSNDEIISIDQQASVQLDKRASIKKGEPWNCELKYHTKSGAELWVSETAIPIKDLEGKVEKVVQVHFDISHLKKTEEALRYKSDELIQINEDLNTLNEELKTFSYSVSHDLKAPLRAIQGFSANLKKRYADQLDGNGKRWLDFIDVNARRMNDLIVDILEYSRIGRLGVQTEVVNLENVFERQYRLLRTTYNNQKIEFRPTKLPKVEADPALLNVIVHNLLSNAFKYASKRKVIKITIRYVSKADHHEISIEDNGIGFDMKYYDQIFGVFKRLHHNEEYEGNGVGLANVRRAVEKLNGEIHAFSEPDKGATFTFLIPKEPSIEGVIA